MKKIIIIMVAALLAPLGCKKDQLCPTVSPYQQRQQLQVQSALIDPDIKRIFDNPTITKKPNKQIQWSPDAKKFAFIRSKEDVGETVTSRLWVFEVENARKRPLIFDDKLVPEEFAWLNADEMVVRSGALLMLINIDGQSETILQSDGPIQNIAASPDGQKIAYRKKDNLFVTDLASRTETQITRNEQVDGCFGCVSWVYSEEFDTKTGFGWSPDSTRLWLQHVDETKVQKHYMGVDSEGQPVMQAYPTAGSENPVVRTGVVDMNSATFDIRWMDTTDTADVYQPDVRWHPGGTQIAVTKFDRLQTHVSLLFCKVDDGSCKTVVEESSPMWVNHLGPPVFTRDGTQFLWLSERDGFSHIYLYSEAGVLQQQLTRGKWTVRSIDRLDSAGGEVYFTANMETPVSYGIYRMKMDGSHSAAVSAAGGVHEAAFAPDAKWYVDTFSSLNRSPGSWLYSVDGEQLANVDLEKQAAYTTPARIVNEIYSLKAGEIELYAHITRPAVIDQTRKYPALVYVYGGPGYQAVLDQFHTTISAWRNMMAMRGVVVFTVDNRGTAGRGRDFETQIHRDLMTTMLSDQLAGVKHLSSLPYVDASRIGIFGWSFGGTAAIASLLQKENPFRMGVAVAPVTDWRLYDTAYTERYMQRPMDNEEGYERTSLLGAADQLEVPLMLIHGMADDNVHLNNSTQLLDAFVAAGKMPQTLFYPKKGHSIKGSTTRAHLFSAISLFIESNL